MRTALSISISAFFVILVLIAPEPRWRRRPWFIDKDSSPRPYFVVFGTVVLIGTVLHAVL